MTLHATPYTPAEPVPLLRSTPPSQPFPLEALGPLRAAAEAIHDITQAPLAICAQSVMSVASLAAQALHDAETLHGKAPSSLFFLTIAGSGERKSACDRLAMRPVKAFEQELSDARHDDLTAWQNRHALWEVDRKRVLGGKTIGTAREADLRALGAEPEPPLHSAVVSGEPTLEGLTKNMHLLRPSLGIFSDEGGSFLGGHGMSAENRLKTVAGLSGLWDGTPVTRWRAGDGVASFAGRRLAIHLMTQPVAAESLLGDPIASGQGFLARFLIAEPESLIGTRTREGHSPRSEGALAEFDATIGELLRRPLPLRSGARNELDPAVLTLSPAARERLRTFSFEVETAQAKGGSLDGIRPFASKAAEHAARLATILSVYNHDAFVLGETMDHAVAILWFYLQEASRLTDAATISRETAEAERMRIWLIESWPEDFISPGDAAQRGPFKETARAKRALEALERNAWLLRVEEGAEILGRHRREAWLVVRAT